MARTVQEIYDIAIYLIDAQNETTGATNMADNREYEVRCVGLLNTLINEAYPYSDTYLSSTNGRRPVLSPVTSMGDTIDMDDFICLSVLPSGLAALFVFDEDKSKYNAFWGDYLQRLAQARASLPVTNGFEDIENPYGWGNGSNAIEYDEFSRWNY